MSWKKRLVALGATAVIASLALSGCSKAGDSAGAATASAGQKITIGVVITGISMYPYYQAQAAGIEAAAKAEGSDVDVVVLASQASDQTEQSNVEQMINRKVNALIFTPGSAEAGAALATQAKNAGIPVVAVDRKAGDATAAYVGYDNVKLGEAMATYAVKQLGGKGNIGGEIGVAGVVNVINRAKGWQNVISQNPGITYVGEVETGFDPAQAYTVTQNLLTGHPETQYLLVMDDNTALGTIRAVNATGKAEKVVGHGAQTAGLKAVQDGDMAATVLMKPYELGYVGLQTAVKIARGEKYDPAPTFDNPVITKDNVADFIGKEGVGW